MGAYTYYTDEEIQYWHNEVTDAELKQLVEETNKATGRVYFAREYIRSATRFMKKPLKKPIYSLYVKVSDGEVKCINFEPLQYNENQSSLNYTVDRSYISTYLFGVLTGVKIANQLTPSL